MTRTISPLTSPRKRRASSAERAARDLLVHLGQLAADGGRAVGRDRGQRRQRLADPARATRRRSRSRPSAGPAPSRPSAAAGSPRSASGRSAGRRRPARPAPPRGRAARSPRGRGRCSGGSAGSRGRRSPACRRRRRGRRCRRARSAAPARSPAPLRCPRGWRPAAAPAGSRACRAGRRCGGCPRRRCSRRRPAPRAPAAVMSSRFPIGVGQTISSPGISPLAPLELDPGHRRGADHPGVVAELGGEDRRLVHRRQRPLAQLAPRRLEQQVAGGDHAAADHDHVRARRCWRSWPGRRRAGGRSGRRRRSRSRRRRAPPR